MASDHLSHYKYDYFPESHFPSDSLGCGTIGKWRISSYVPLALLNLNRGQSYFGWVKGNWFKPDTPIDSFTALHRSIENVPSRISCYTPLPPKHFGRGDDSGDVTIEEIDNVIRRLRHRIAELEEAEAAGTLQIDLGVLEISASADYVYLAFEKEPPPEVCYLLRGLQFDKRDGGDQVWKGRRAIGFIPGAPDAAPMAVTSIVFNLTAPSPSQLDFLRHSWGQLSERLQSVIAMIYSEEFVRFNKLESLCWLAESHNLEIKTAWHKWSSRRRNRAKKRCTTLYNNGFIEVVLGFLSKTGAPKMVPIHHHFVGGPLGPGFRVGSGEDHLLTLTRQAHALLSAEPELLEMKKGSQNGQ